MPLPKKYVVVSLVTKMSSSEKQPLSRGTSKQYESFFLWLAGRSLVVVQAGHLTVLTNSFFAHKIYLVSARRPVETTAGIRAPTHDPERASAQKKALTITPDEHVTRAAPNKNATHLCRRSRHAVPMPKTAPLLANQLKGMG